MSHIWSSGPPGPENDHQQLPLLISRKESWKTQKLLHELLDELNVLKYGYVRPARNLAGTLLCKPEDPSLMLRTHMEKENQKKSVQLSLQSTNVLNIHITHRHDDHDHDRDKLSALGEHLVSTCSPVPSTSHSVWPIL